MVRDMQVHRGIAVRVRPVMPILVVVMVERSMVTARMFAFVMRDRHHLPTPRAERKLRKQHHARHGPGG